MSKFFDRSLLRTAFERPINHFDASSTFSFGGKNPRQKTFDQQVYRGIKSNFERRSQDKCRKFFCASISNSSLPIAVVMGRAWKDNAYWISPNNFFRAWIGSIINLIMMCPKIRTLALPKIVSADVMMILSRSFIYLFTSNESVEKVIL